MSSLVSLCGCVVHFEAYCSSFIRPFCRVSALLGLESLMSQQALREAFSESELLTAKHKHQQIQEHMQVEQQQQQLLFIYLFIIIIIIIIIIVVIIIIIIMYYYYLHACHGSVNHKCSGVVLLLLSCAFVSYPGHSYICYQAG